MSQPHGQPASPVGSAGCKQRRPTPIPLRLPSGRGGRVQPDRAAVPCPAAPPNPSQSRVSLSRAGCMQESTSPRGPSGEYPGAMNESTSKPLGRTIIAGLVLLIAAWLLLHFVIGIVTAIASVL